MSIPDLSLPGGLIVKAPFITGLILIGGGIFLIVRPPHYSSEHRVLEFGGLTASVRQERPLPGWVGGIVLGAGLVLLSVGLLKR
jgi:hypothetical protein